MKLAYQAILLVAIPLIFELACVYWLGTMVRELDSSLSREARAKEIVSILTSQLKTSVDVTLFLAECAFDRNEEYQRHEINSVIAKQFERYRELTKLVHDDPEATKLVAKLSSAYRNLLLASPQLRESINPEVVDTPSRLLGRARVWMNAMQSARLRERYIDDLLEIYGRALERARTEAVEKRKKVKQAVLLIIALNALIAIVLAMRFSSTTAKRLESLLVNIDRFASGEELLAKIAGKDEIAELDSTFRDMAEARQRSDQVRRDMVAMVSHDLKKPLTDTTTFVKQLMTGEHGEAPPKFKNILTKMDSELQRLMRLVNDLSDIDMIESGSLEITMEDNNVTTIVSDSIGAVRGIAELKEIALRVEAPEDFSLRCDSDRVIQVLVNLLSNAVKFSSSGKEIFLKVIVESGKETVRFEVHDEGPGISQSAQALVFDRFKQLEQDRAVRSTGSGLGLTICKTIVERHGGTIGVISYDGKGACFWFILPSDNQAALREAV